MLHFLPSILRGIIASLILATNTLVLCWPLFIGALFKAALPFPAARRVINRAMHWCAETWIDINKFWMNLVQRTRWDVRGLEGDKTAKAKRVGELVAERAKSAGIEAVVFDRGGNKYHGRVAAVADGAREGGLKL